MDGRGTVAQGTSARGSVGKQPGSELPWREVLFGIFWGALLIVAVLLTMTHQPSKTSPPAATNVTAVFALAGAVAVGIERLLEAMWTFVDGLADEWWPLSWIGGEARKKVQALDTALQPAYTAASAALDAAVQQGKETKEAANTLKQEIGVLHAGIDQVTALAKQGSSAYLPPLVSQASTALSAFQAKCGVAGNIIDTSNQALTDLADFVDRFQENPGRRLLSLSAGVILGLCVVSVLQLNLFSGLIANSVGGMVMTGFVVGLGANPTHEVIQAIQAYKASQKGNAAASANGS